MRVTAVRLHYRRAWLAAGMLLVGFAVWFSLQAVPPSWAYAWGEKPLHGAVYAALVFWFGQIYRGPRTQLAIVAAFIGLGITLELMQLGMTTTRRLDGADMLANSAGAIGAWALLRTRARFWLQAVDARLAGRG